MSARISDERHQELLDYYTDVSHCFSSLFERDVASALRENKHSRALVTELRALLDGNPKYEGGWANHSAWLISQLRSLLSAHGGEK